MLDIYRAERSAVLWFGARSNDLSGENVKRRDKKFRPLPADIREFGLVILCADYAIMM